MPAVVVVSSFAAWSTAMLLCVILSTALLSPAHAMLLRGKAVVHEDLVSAAPGMNSLAPLRSGLTPVDGYDNLDGSLTNLCSCKCCSEVVPGRLQCYRDSKLVIEVSKCAVCDARTCASKFHNICTARASLVKADCVERKALFLRVVPLVFIVASIVLVGYALFSGRDDASTRYWEIREGVPSGLRAPGTVLKDVPPAQLATPLEPMRSECPSPRLGIGKPEGASGEHAALLESAVDALRFDSSIGSSRVVRTPSPLSRSSTPPLTVLSTVPEVDEEEEEGEFDEEAV